MTTTLALFAKRHGSHCVSYFNNGWSRYLLNPRVIASSLQLQLEQAKANVEDNDSEKNLTTWVYQLNKMTRGKNCYVFFVFDGFENLFVVFVDGIESVLAPLFSVSNARFIPIRSLEIYSIPFSNDRH